MDKQAWNVLALDGSNWQKIDLFNFQTDIEVKKQVSSKCFGLWLQIQSCVLSAFALYVLVFHQ